MNIKKGWVIYPKSTLKNSTNAFEWLMMEAKKFDIEIEVKFFEDFYIESGEMNSFLYENRKFENPNFIVMRGYEFLLSKHFELLEIPVINTADSMSLSLNKMLTHQILTKNNIPTPKTIYNSESNYNYDYLSQHFKQQRFVIKSLDGSKGEGVFLINNQNELENAVLECNNKCLAQEFIESSFGKDIRTWVIGDKVVASVLRYSENSFKSNFSQGGKVSLYPISKEVEELSVLSTKSLGLEFAGVDLLIKENDYTICEINGNSGFRSISSISDESIPFCLFKYINEKYF